MRLSVSIPPLKDLLFDRCGYTVPPFFTTDFVALHQDDWEGAERDWEDIVALTLDTDAVDRRASGGTAIKQAVEAAAAFLTDDDEWPWCPICRRTSADRAEGGDS